MAFETDESVLNSEVSSFQRLLSTQMWHLRQMNSEVSSFQRLLSIYTNVASVLSWRCPQRCIMQHTTLTERALGGAVSRLVKNLLYLAPWQQKKPHPFLLNLCTFSDDIDLGDSLEVDNRPIAVTSLVT